MIFTKIRNCLLKMQQYDHTLLNLKQSIKIKNKSNMSLNPKKDG